MAIQTPNADEFEMPEEFNVETPAGADEYTPAQEHGQSTGALTLDDLDQIGVDEARDEQERKKLYPPPGDWVKSDEWEYRVARIQGDTVQGDIHPDGRTIYIFFGKPEEKIDKDGNVHQPTLNFRMSPDRRYKQDDPSKVDHMYALYLKAKDLYLFLFSEKLKRQGDLVRMMVSDSYIINTFNGDSGPFVREVKPRRVQKNRNQ